MSPEEKYQSLYTKALEVITLKNQTISRLQKEADALRVIRQLMGFVEDGSDKTVKLGQDDATRSFFIIVDGRTYDADSFAGVIEAAKKGEDL